MEQIISITSGVLRETWNILNESSPYIFIGFTIAALLKAFIPDSFIQKQLGGNGPLSVLKAALFGVPIPLCSCGVIPAAMGLRKQGASRGATMSFLISTPETGVDSIAITYALLGPVYAIFRPVAAFFSALIAGLLENFLNKQDDHRDVQQNATLKSCECGGCCATGIEAAEAEKPSLKQRISASFGYAFGDLLADIGKWLVIGILLAGIIAYAVPDNFLGRYGSGHLLSYLIMLVAGIPIYICATASTPLAAALILKGVSPGAALVFLLAGPATNAATMTVVGKTMGRKSLAIYLSSIAVTSLIAGYILDLIFIGTGVNITGQIFTESESSAWLWIETAMSILLLILIARSLWLEKLERIEKNENYSNAGSGV